MALDTGMPPEVPPSVIERLLRPRHIALIGGVGAQAALAQCRLLGYTGEIWPIHPHHASIDGQRCYADVAALPEAPDASFVAVNALATIAQVSALNACGAGGAVCYASGFAEVGPEGEQRQQALVEAAGAMPLLGPNCYGMLNYLDGVALWPDQHGGQRVRRGVAIITQSGNIGLNLTMQRRGLPLAYLITLGNQAGCDFAQLIEALLLDDRVTAIGLHIEGLGNINAFAEVALRALAKGIPLVALKSGSSAKGAEITLSHTSSLSGSDQLYDALFERCGIARVFEPTSLLETLKFLHVHGSLQDRRIASASCSGGEASLVADLAERHGLIMPALPPAIENELKTVLGPKVHVANPLDYHTYIWGDLPAQTACFTALLNSHFDNHLLLLDFPRLDHCNAGSWQTTLQAFEAAQVATGAKASVVSSLPEGLPEALAAPLLAQGIAPMMGVSECLQAIRHAAFIGARQRSTALVPPAAFLQFSSDKQSEPVLVRQCLTLDEFTSKKALGAYGLKSPEGYLLTPAGIASQSVDFAYPVVLKAVATSLHHKTEAGGVALNLQSRQQLLAALQEMQHLSSKFLVEAMVQNPVAEMIVGLHKDPQFGLVLTIGAGGVLVELMNDSKTLLLPTTADEIHQALNTLRMAPSLHGYRGRPRADVDAVVVAILAIARYAQDHTTTLFELDVNPLLVMPQGQGVLMVDALIRHSHLLNDTHTDLTN